MVSITKLFTTFAIPHIIWPVATRKLLKWHETNQRKMPWKETTDPIRYGCRNSSTNEGGAGLPYYKRIIRKFPTVRHLAMASEDDVLKSWEGLAIIHAQGIFMRQRAGMNDHDGEFRGTKIF